MFLHFSKIRNSNPAQIEGITVRLDSIMLITEDVLENRTLNVNYTATRVEISSFPNYTFHTTASMNTVAALLEGVVDVTGGAGSGSTCAGDPGVLDLVYAEARYPMLRVNMLVNSSKHYLQEHVINPEYLVFAEDLVFIDSFTRNQDSALLMVMRDSQPKRLLVDLTLADLDAILDPTVVPV